MFHVFTPHLTSLGASPAACVWGNEQESPEFSKSLNLGESLEFFQVPEPIWRRQKNDNSYRQQVAFEGVESLEFF